MPTTRSLVRTPLLAAVVAVLAFASFAAAATGPFLLDDVPLIANNGSVHALANWREWLVRDFWDVDLGRAQLGARLNYFRPLVLASYALDWQLGAGSSLVLHATNLVLHVGVALLAFLTLRRWLGTPLSAFAGALVFAVHPTKAESVAWISGRPDLLVTLGMLLASWGMARRLRRQSGAVLLELAGTSMAYLSKEHAVALPVFAFVECWVFLGRPGLDPGSIRRGLRAALPQLAVAAAYLTLRHFLLPLRPFGISGLSVPRHAELVLETVGRLTALAFWPDDLSLGQATISMGVNGPRSVAAYALLGGVLVVLTLLVALFGGRRRPAWVLALLLWSALLLPVSNLMWSGLRNLTSARFAYLPLLGLAWLTAELFGFARELGWRKWSGSIMAALVLLLAARAMLRTVQFGSVTAFWGYELVQHPDQAPGYVFAVEHAKAEGRPRQALQLAVRGFARTARHYSQDLVRSTLLVQALQQATALTPDARRAELEDIDAFVARLSGSQPARLLLGDLVLDVPGTLTAWRDLALDRARLLLIRSDIATRLGDNARGLELARRAVEACPHCTSEWESAAALALRAGDQDLARAWLLGSRNRPWAEVPARLRGLCDSVRTVDARLSREQGPTRVQLQVQRDLLLGLPGQAYAVLWPHREAVAQAGEAAALSLAEVAARAGETDAARAVLSGLAGVSVEERLGAWETQMGWRDAPLAETDDDELERTLARLAALGPGFSSRRGRP